MAARALAFYTLCIFLCSLHGVVTGGSYCVPGVKIPATSHHKKPLHLTYFVHETRDLGAANSTLLLAAGSGVGNLSAIGWGTFMVFDNPMKSGKASNSLHLGSITGTIAMTTIGTHSDSLMTAQHNFKEGSKFNGSSLTLIGTVLTLTPPFECIVAGGTGLLRGYSGYGIMNPVTEATVPPLYVYKWDIHITYKK